MAEYNVTCIFYAEPNDVPELQHLLINNEYGHYSIDLNKYYEKVSQSNSTLYDDCFNDLIKICDDKYQMFINLRQYPEIHSNVEKIEDFPHNVSDQFAKQVVDFCRKYNVGYRLVTWDGEKDEFAIAWDEKSIKREWLEQYMAEYNEHMGPILSDIEISKKLSEFNKYHEIILTGAIMSAVESGISAAFRSGIDVGISEGIVESKARDIAMKMIQAVTYDSIEPIADTLCHCIDNGRSQDQAFENTQSIVRISAMANAVGINDAYDIQEKKFIDQAQGVDSKTIKYIADAVVDIWLMTIIGGIRKAISIGMEMGRTFFDVLNDAKNQSLSMVKLCLKEKYVESESYMDWELPINVNNFVPQSRIDALTTTVSIAMHNSMASVIDKMNEPGYDMDKAITQAVEQAIVAISYSNKDTKNSLIGREFYRDLYVVRCIARNIANDMINAKKEEIKNKNANIGG